MKNTNKNFGQDIVAIIVAFLIALSAILILTPIIAHGDRKEFNSDSYVSYSFEGEECSYKIEEAPIND